MRCAGRIAILGNSGSGKTTLARAMASASNAALLDLDTIYWEPAAIAVSRPPQAARDDLAAFCTANPRWVIEGCYADLVESALDRDGPLSLKGHLALYEAYAGPKQLLTGLPALSSLPSHAP